MVILISLLAVVTTILGGMFALRFKDKLHLVLGFSAGAVIAVAFFDLLPEALELSGTTYDIDLVTSVVAISFLVYMSIDRLIVLHSHQDEHVEGHGARGTFGAGSLALHSFLDGLAIGLAFQVSSAVGAIVTAAILVHDFSDGINMVNVVLKNGGTKKQAMAWLTLDAVAPIFGAASTLLFSVPSHVLGLVLATFCGFFLYIGASDLLPESHHSHPTKWTTFATIVGAAVLFIAIKIAHHA